MPALEQMDRTILDMLQNDFPLAVQPYLEMANRLNVTEDELLARISAMKDKGLIRRIGGIFDSHRMGFYSTLCALTVPEEKIEEAAALINGVNGVTHNYIRDHKYNMWFTLTVSSQEQAVKVLTELENLLGLEIISMPAQKVYKIKVSFDMESSDAI